VEEVGERAARGLGGWIGVGEEIEAIFGGDAFVEEFILGSNRRYCMGGRRVEFFGAGILREEAGVL